MALFRLHTVSESDDVIVAIIKLFSPYYHPELSEVSSEFSELERTVIFRLLVKSDGEAEMAVDAENVIGAFAIGNAHFRKLLRFGVNDGTAVTEQHIRLRKILASVRVALLIQSERNLVATIYTNLSVVIKAVPATSPRKKLTHTVFILLLATCAHCVSENDWCKPLPDITVGILYYEVSVSDDTFNVHLRSLFHRGKLQNVSL